LSEVATKHQGTAAEKRALNAYIALMRASESVTSRLAPRLAEVGLTDSQFGVMEALHHLGPMCQAELGRKILKTSGNMTMVIDNLEKRWLVRRERDAHDRRFVTVHLTDEGAELIDGFFPEHAAAITREMSVLTAADQEALRTLCRRLGKGGA